MAQLYKNRPFRKRFPKALRRQVTTRNAISSNSSPHQVQYRGFMKINISSACVGQHMLSLRRWITCLRFILSRKSEIQRSFQIPSASVNNNICMRIILYADFCTDDKLHRSTLICIKFAWLFDKAVVVDTCNFNETGIFIY